MSDTVTFKTFDLDRRWQAEFTAPAPPRETVGFWVKVSVLRENGEWELVLQGRVFRNGTCDWGMGVALMIRFHGRRDADLLGQIADHAAARMRGD